ncbi:guanitoxin biosynthesis heme-dependent pre-guanitoxin N-hydroxylase GntA [Micromonospora aurantiaca (nom. illeg.)]|uniref:guanitoxin biosynthesis heme-dependent pre-guanitoxin N-hydroxylase GntA n=1 Tax=Micromonospora aurantiaca (nom. illeg.) TaxID=47850 RepID=UPI0036CB4AE6
MVADDDLSAQFADRIASPDFSCLGARTALRRKSLVCAVYGTMNDLRTSRSLHGRLVAFVEEMTSREADYPSFAAIFRAPLGHTEESFERDLWRQLHMLRQIDEESYGWAPGVSADPASPRYAYSVAGHPFFVVGMHSRASRISRRFSHPTLVFNSHLQLDRLKSNGVFAALQRKIRQREVRLQGSINPNLSDFGQAPESLQYSGRVTPAGWRCPPTAGEEESEHAE